MFPRDKAKWPEFAQQQADDLFRQRKAKIPLLANHLGIDFDHLDLTNYADLALFYGSLAIRLAIELVPGFQEAKAGKWPREIVMWTLVACEHLKSEGKVNSDLTVCLDAVKAWIPRCARIEESCKGSSSAA